jgi:hypothetical protein
MTALSVQPPFPILTDIDGQPLEDGFIFIGVVNLAPIANPITVYWDAALTVTATQPIRTRGGYPMNAGVPGRLYVNTDYSIQVQNRNGSVVYTSLDNNGPLGGGSISSVDVTFLQAGANAIERTAQAKMRESVSVTDFGVVANGTDQTTQIVAAFVSLGLNYDGVILIPGNIKFDFNQVVPAIPYKAVVQFTNTMQAGSGYRQQLTGIMSNPPDANTDTAFAIVDPHYPDVMVNNPRTSGTTSGNAGLSGLSWAQGFYTNGTKGPRIQWQFNFRKSVVRTTEYAGAGVACFEIRTRFPERALNYEDWFNGIVVQINDYILSTNGAFYRALTAGTSTVAPTFTSGSQTVGGVTWQWEDGSWVNFRVPFYIDELGRIGNLPVPTGQTQLWQQNPEDPENFNVFYEASGASKKIQFHFRPTNSGSTRGTVSVFDFTDTAGFRLLSGDESKIFFIANNTVGFSLGQYGLRTLQPSDGNTTPSVNSAGQLRVNNSAATSITNFIDASENQEVSLFFTNGNTTLVHSSALVLKGGINVTPTANQIITLTREPSASAYWVEKSRNF